MSQVLARRGIPRGRVSRPFRISDLKTFTVAEREDVYLDLNDQGYIITTNIDGIPLPPSSFTRCSIAGDVQNKNLELYSDDNELRMRLLKDVAPDDVLELWFSEDVLARIDMPFLIPRNIIGRKSYICHECGVQFEQPNPLKLHLFLSCQVFTAKKFWKRFVSKFNEEIVPLNLSLDNFTRNVHSDRPKSQENVDKTNLKSDILRCNSEPPSSAFKPYKIGSDWFKHFNNNAPIAPRLIPSHIYNPAYALQKNWHIQNMNTVSKSLERVSMTNPAEIEMLATNWGKSKEGHLCLYCGKVYSRKYGLKIHIRTHTGYKPLQCKYCLRPFGDPSNLNKHVRLHAQSETPYNCSLCGKMLVRKRDLERHLRSRHADEDIVKICRNLPSP